MSTIHSERKIARLESRCTVQQKNIVQQAASLSGLSLTDFTVSSVLEKAMSVISKQSMIDLSLKDQEKFVRVLLASPEPNNALLEAKERYQKKI